ncbi:MAG: hypothetical protein KJ645_00050 [Planctomycetes bacterium]|nr:hypothetical protein [Planctomycetota bacterium]
MYKKITMGLVLTALILSTPLWAATFTVTNNLDAGAGSLRWAITQANATLGWDNINFNIGGGGFWTINPLTPLPALTDPNGVLIDGLTQPGAVSGANPPSTARLMIEVNGLMAGPAHGIWIQSNGNTVQGLIVNDFEQDGFRIEGGIANPTADNNLLYCNFVGTDFSGTIGQGNGRNTTQFWAGIHICNVPGGQANYNIADRNLSSSNWAEGVWVEGPRQPGDVGFNNILFNYIGTDLNGIAPLGNMHEGVCLTEGTHDNLVDSNLISANFYDGVGIQGYNNYGYPVPPIQTFNNTVSQNIIGLDINLNPLGNTMHGVAIGEYGPSQWGCADYNIVSLNTIAHNGRAGVAVWEDWINNTNADHNLITQNSIYANGGLGIDLENDNVTANDYPNDPDTGANQWLNFPVINVVNYNMGVTTISGWLDIDTAENTATIEVFLAPLDPSGFGEGSFYLGSTIPDAFGNWTLNTNMLIPGDYVSATTSDASNNTSEFCQNAQVPGTPTLTSSTRTLSESAGGIVNFALNAGAANGNRYYLVLGTASGTVPGFLLPWGLATMPLNWDWFTQLTFDYLNIPPFLNFLGVLSPAGQGSAQLNTFGPLPPGAAGVTLHFAFCCNNPFNFVSNPVGVLITP